MNKKVLRWNFIFQYGYVLSNIFNSAILLPLYLKHIDAGTLGLWLATGNILAWMTLVDPGVGDVLQQQIAALRGQNNHQMVGTAIGSGLIASAIILVLSIIIGFVFYFLLGHIIDKNVSLYPGLSAALMISIIATGLSLVSFSISGINQGMHNTAHVATASLLSNLVFLIINIIFLFLGYGIVSIAFANLCRALFLNIYNLAAMIAVNRRESVIMRFHTSHFRRFIRIFSFTSLSRIISGLSGSIDLIVLARFIPPGMITMFEINKRPIKLAQSLIGRHSVALMPSVSHAYGKGERESIIALITTQFKFYCYAAFFVSIAVCMTYSDLISAWTGPGHYAGALITYLLVANFLSWLIGYFMSNMGYALGDLKINSLVNITRGVLIGVLMYFVAGRFGIPGTLTVSLAVTLFTDFFFFTYRVYKLGYMPAGLLKKISTTAVILVPCTVVAGVLSKIFVIHFIPDGFYFTRVILVTSIISITYILLLLPLDPDMLKGLKSARNSIYESGLMKRIRTKPGWRTTTSKH